MNLRAPVAGLVMLLASSAQAQESVTVGVIDFYGLRSISEVAVRAQLPFSEGTVLMPESGFDEVQKEAEMAAALGVERVDLTPVCCPAPGALVVYVGVQEHPIPSLQYREAPTGTIVLPPELLDRAAQLEAATIAGIMAGQSGDDWSQGHALFEYAEARAIQLEFVDFAAENFDLLADVLENGAQHRDVAAMVIAYAPDKRTVVPHLEAAVLDPDPGVRNNAMRALGVLARFATEKPDLGIRLRDDFYVDLLDSVDFADRNKAAMVLVELTRSPRPEVIAALRQRALPSLIEMCRWTLEGHHYPPCKLLERAVGMPPADALHPREETLRKAEAMLAASRA